MRQFWQVLNFANIFPLILVTWGFRSFIRISLRSFVIAFLCWGFISCGLRNSVSFLWSRKTVIGCVVVLVFWLQDVSDDAEDVREDWFLMSGSSILWGLCGCGRCWFVTTGSHGGGVAWFGLLVSLFRCSVSVLRYPVPVLWCSIPVIDTLPLSSDLQEGKFEVEEWSRGHQLESDQHN